jgi:adenylate cyclase
VAAEVAVRVAGDNAAISKHVAGLSRNKVASELTAYEAMLRFWESVSRLTPQSMARAIRALEQAVAHEPDHGQTWSMLAAQYAENYGLEIIDLATPLEKAAEFAQRGVSLDPTNRRTRITLAYVRFMQNKLPEAQYEAHAAYHLCPNSLMVLDAIGWLTALSGEWERGVTWIEKAIKLNPYYRPRVRQALFLNWFRAGDYEKAYRETLHFMMPGFYWDHLLKASACGQLGKIEEGQACVRALLALKPDFAKRGRILIGRYVKFEDIVDRIIEGLSAVGIKISQ